MASPKLMEPIWKARDWRVRSALVSVSLSLSGLGYESRAVGEEADSQGSGGGSCVKLWNTFKL